MKNEIKTIRVLTGTSGHSEYNYASHALLKLDLSCLESIREKTEEAQDIQNRCNEFSHLCFRDNDYRVLFFDLCLCDTERLKKVLGGVDDVLSEVDKRSSRGETIYVPPKFSIPEKSLYEVSSLNLYIDPDNFYWGGYDFRTCYISTESFSLVQLREWETYLGVTSGK